MYGDKDDDSECYWIDCLWGAILVVAFVIGLAAPCLIIFS